MARYVIFKEDGLAGTSNTPSGYRYLGYDGTSPSEKSGATVSGLGGLPYKVYTALLTQVSDSAPTAVVLQNTLSGTPTWGYGGTGTYTLTLTSEFPTQNKVWVIVGADINGTGYSMNPYWGDANTIYLDVYDPANSLVAVDSGLTDTPIEVRVYP